MTTKQTQMRQRSVGSSCTSHCGQELTESCVVVGTCVGAVLQGGLCSAAPPLPERATFGKPPFAGVDKCDTLYFEQWTAGAAGPM